MNAVILAAGYATRLYPLTIGTPKSLLSVGGRTILDRLCEKLRGLSGLERITLVSNAKFYDQFKQWSSKTDYGVPVVTIDDGTTSNDTRLGAIGDLALALAGQTTPTDVLMLASDNLFTEDFSGFVRFCDSRKGKISVGVYDLKDPALAANKFGVLEVDGQHKVVCIEEKPAKPKSSLIGMGIYYFPAKTLHYVGEYLEDREAKDAPGYYIRWLSAKTDIYSYLFSGLWYDIGTLEALNEANRLFK